MKWGCLSGMLCALATLGAWGAERTPDGYGLVEALTGTSSFGSQDPSPFRYAASAVSSGTLGSSSTHAIDRGNANAWAPQCVYQIERYGADMTTTFTDLVPGAAYKVELHLSECYFGGSNGGDGTGKRVWNALINGVSVETGIDIYKQAGGAWKALVKQYACTADANGRIAVRMQKTTDNAHFSGIAVFGTAVPSGATLSGSRVAGTADLAFSWSGKDTLRYYLERSSTGETGPWTTVGGPYAADVTRATLTGAYDAAATAWYRIVASNGVGTVATDCVRFEPSGVTDSLATTGERIADNAAALYGLETVGAASAGPNMLATDSVTAAGYMLETDGDSTLSLGAGQLFSVGLLGVGDHARQLTVSGEGTLAAKEGVLGLSVRDADARLLVTAPLSGGTAGTISKNGAGTVTVAGFTGVSGLAVNDGAFVYSNAVNEALTTVLNGKGTFAKAGDGKLTVTSANPAFEGDVVVKAGTLQFGRTGSVFENSAGTLTVEPGGALDVATPDLGSETVKLGSRKVVVSGAGPDGKGAIVSSCTKSQYNALANGELSGDVVFGGGGSSLSETVGRWDFRNGAVNLNGHSIRKVGKNMVCLTGIALTGDTGVTIDVEDGYWSSETTTSYSGGPQNAFNISRGAYLDFYNISKPLTWSLNLADGAYVQVRNGDAAKNHFTGPVNLAAGTVNLLAKSSSYATLDGVVSGEGRLRSVSQGGGRVTLANPANTYSGGTLIEGGDLSAVYKGSLPGYDDPAKLAISNATLIVTLADGAGNTWGVDDVRAFSARGQLKTNNSRVGVIVEDVRTFSGGLSIPMGTLAKYGEGELRFDEPMRMANGGFEQFLGTTTFTGSGAEVSVTSTFKQQRGIVAFDDGASLTTATNTPVYIGNVERALARLVVSNATLRTVEKIPVNQGTSGIYVGSGSQNNSTINSARGVLEVHGDSVISNMYNVGYGLRAQGAIHQYGGRVVNCGGAANDIRLGNYGYGYLELNGGYHEWMGYGQVCSQGSAASGVFVQHGGTFEFNQGHQGRMAINRSNNGGHGEIYQDGGVFTVKSFIEMGEEDNNRGGVSWWTVDGNATAVVQDQVEMSDRTNHVAVLNLNGGTLETKYIAARPKENDGNYATAKAFVNFNGGTYRARADGEIFRGDANHRPTAVTIYAAGATFDTAGHNSSIQVPLVKPAGRGLASITVPNLTDYIGSPVFTITGDGEGATAHAVYDAKTGRITAVKITSPGTGYTTATVTSTDGGWTNIVASTATLADNATTGGLTKKGAGTLTLTAANTFGGAVTVEEGRLVLKHPAAFPAGSDLVVTGGTLDLLGNTITAGVVRVTGGTVANGRVVCHAFNKEGAGTFTFDAAGVTAGHGRPGLWSGTLSGAANLTDPNPCTEIVAAPTMANSTTGWQSNMTWVYTGYVWNRSAEDVTWTFVSYFDDGVQLKIDGRQILYTTQWSDQGKGRVTLSPGPHAFELRLLQGTGDAGPSGANGKPGWGKGTGMGFGVDFQGRDSTDAANFVRFEDCANIAEIFSLDVGGAQIAAGGVTVKHAGGDLAGLLEGVLDGKSNWTAPNPCTATTPTVSKAQTKTGWSENTTACYTGYIWNTNDVAVTWTFAESFDDYVRVWIDGQSVIANDGYNFMQVGTLTLTPGPHAFEARFSEASGGAGPSFATNAVGGTATPPWGFAIDFQGRGEARISNFTKVDDELGRALFTTAVPFSGSAFDGVLPPVVLADGAMLSYEDSTDAGATVPSLGATGAVAGGNVTVSKFLVVDVDDLIAGKFLAAAGTLTLADGAAIWFENADRLQKKDRYVLVESTDGISVDPSKIALRRLPENSHWQIFVSGGKLMLGYPTSTVIYFR